MRYLVTGGCGFIGSHLADRLVAAGNEVVVLDDLSTGSRRNVAELEGRRGFRLIVGSVLDDDLVADLTRDADGVLHLASAVGVKLIMQQPVETIDEVFRGTDVVLNAADRHRTPVLIASSSEVYGKSTDIPFVEEGDRLVGSPMKHRWAYACAKSLAEFQALAHWKESRLPVIVVRLFNTAGPRQTGRYGMVIPRFVDAALRGEPIAVYGDGRQSRCFAHVADVVEGLVALLSTPAAHGNVVNLGSDEEVTIGDLAVRINGLAGSKSRIEYVPYDRVYGDSFEDMQRRVPSLEKAGRLIGWKPRRSLDVILTDVIEYRRGS